MNTLNATWEGVIAVRNGYWDQFALQGCPKEYADYGCTEFTKCEGCGQYSNPTWGGMRGVFQNTGVGTAWNATPPPLSDPQTLYQGTLQLDPLDGNACQGFDQYQDEYSPGSEYSPSRYPSGRVLLRFI